MKNPQGSRGNISFLLINPKRSENIGAAARALMTMGFQDCLEILSREQMIPPDAFRVAHGSCLVLDRAALHSNLDDALRGSGLIIGTTARSRTLKRDILPIWEAAALALEDRGSVKFLFGPEDTGLNNEILSRCHILTEIPMACTQPSLNLAQSVMVTAYELSVQASRPLTDRSRTFEEQDKQDDLSRGVLIERVNTLFDRLDLPDRGTLRLRTSQLIAGADREQIRLFFRLLALADYPGKV